MEITIPFREEWRNKMLNGNKTCASRTKQYGQVGDTFVWFNHVFELTKIEKHKLDYVAKRLYRQEGCNKPSEFITVWDELHPTKGFNPYQSVFVHFFKLLGKKSQQETPEQFR